MEELGQTLRLRLADRAAATQQFSSCSLVTQDRPNVPCKLVEARVPPSKRSAIRSVRRGGSGWYFLFVILNEQRQYFRQGFLFRRKILHASSNSSSTLVNRACSDPE